LATKSIGVRTTPPFPKGHIRAAVRVEAADDEVAISIDRGPASDHDLAVRLKDGLRFKGVFT
jgi:hypothetical protein